MLNTSGESLGYGRNPLKIWPLEDNGAHTHTSTHTLSARGQVIIRRLKQAGHIKQHQTHTTLSGELRVSVYVCVLVLKFKGGVESKKKIITCKVLTFILY